MTTTTLPAVQARRDDVRDALERRFTRLTRRLSSGSLTLREAVTEVHILHLRAAVLDAAAEVADWPQGARDLYIAAEATRARLEVELDALAGEDVLRRTERRLGQVVVLTDGTRLGPPRPVPVEDREPITGRSLW
ncbi:hypothetical protein ACK8HX_02200 [Oryzobacter sp. R7]|uniref:hypothetical protein n=1 Tax=Oryzobacter faecalis TaxID=3388656 RepID=UPI00398C926B